VRVAVVIPALDEAERVGAAVESARGPDVDVLVVDGGSRDATLEWARAAGARTLDSPPGRGRQLAVGAAAAEGDVVLFLHADTRLPRGWVAAVERALEDPGVVGGAFTLRFAGGGLGLRVIEWGAVLRTRLFALPYGDQALFARREVLEAMGGVPQAPIMEDLDFVRALKQVGRLARIPLAVETSGRRYEGRAMRQMLRNWAALAAWRLGVDRARIAEWYAR
jgi:rSAM/selenodomain-associated transferase 2